jgi:hypothetical protein
MLLGLAILLIGAAPAAAAEPAMVWSEPEPITSTASITGIDCPTTDLCVAVDQRGNAITTINPAGPASGWTSADIVSGEDGINAVSCASSHKCVAVGSNGMRLTSTDPTGGSAAWTETEITGASGLLAVSCNGETCAAYDTEDRIVIWGKPSGGGVEVTKILEVNGGAFVPDDVDCPTSSFCVFIGTESHSPGGGSFDWENAVVTLTNPVESSPSFTHHFIGDKTFLRALSCPTSSFCLAVDEEGDDLVSTAPATAAWESHLIHPNGAQYDSALFDVSCPSEEFCAAVGNPFDVLTSKQPLGGEEDWGGAYLEANEVLSCPSPSLCLAAGGENISFGTPAPPPAPEAEEETTVSFFNGAPPTIDQRPISVPPPPRPPSLRLESSKQIAVKKGKAIVLISCLSYGSCMGGVKLFASPAKPNDGRLATKSRAARIKIASGKFTIGPNRVKRLVVSLNRSGRALLTATDRAVAQLSVDGWSGNQRLSLRKAVVLRAAT